MIKEYLEAGQITSAHGLRGDVRFTPWCDSNVFLKQFKQLYCDAEGSVSYDIEALRPHGNIVLLKLKGVDTVEQAERLRNQVLYIKRSDAHLPDGQYFISELINCTVFDGKTKECYGRITEVSPTGSNDVWHIVKDGKEYYLPAIGDVVKSVDVITGEVIIEPLKGIFDDDEN